MEDPVLIKYHTAGPFTPLCVGEYHVVSIKENQVEVIPVTGGKSKKIHSS